MNKIKKRSAYIRLTALVFLGVVSTPATEAATVTFGNFSGVSGNPFTYSSNTTTATFATASIPVTFTYVNTPNLPPSVNGSLAAHLVINATSTSAAQSVGFGQVGEAGFNGTLTILLDGLNTNLLTVNFVNASLFGGNNGQTFSFGQDTSTSGRLSDVVYTSQYIGFIAVTSNNFSLTFTSTTPSFHLTTGNTFFDPFVASGTGTFASNPGPIGVPEPATAAGMGFGLVAIAAFARRRKA